MLVCVTPALQLKRRYCPSGKSLISERYFMLMNALHVNWLLRKHQIILIMASSAAARMVSPTCIILVLPLFILFLIVSVNSCVPTTVRHESSFHRICPKPQSRPRRLPVVRRWKYWLESQTSVLWPTLKILTRVQVDSSPKRLPSRLSFDRRRNYWLTSQPSMFRPSQPLITHVLDVCPPTVTETKMSPFVSTVQNRIAIMSSLSY